MAGAENFTRPPRRDKGTPATPRSPEAVRAAIDKQRATKKAHAARLNNPTYDETTPPSSSKGDKQRTPRSPEAKRIAAQKQAETRRIHAERIKNLTYGQIKKPGQA